MSLNRLRRIDLLSKMTSAHSQYANAVFTNKIKIDFPIQIKNRYYKFLGFFLLTIRIILF